VSKHTSNFFHSKFSEKVGFAHVLGKVFIHQLLLLFCSCFTTHYNKSCAACNYIFMKTRDRSQKLQLQQTKCYSKRAFFYTESVYQQSSQTPFRNILSRECSANFLCWHCRNCCDNVKGNANNCVILHSISS
jgi:hypothetical protein